jgi:hypothetical protein
MKKVPIEKEINFQKVATGQEAGVVLLKVGDEFIQDEEGAWTK